MVPLEGWRGGGEATVVEPCRREQQVALARGQVEETERVRDRAVRVRLHPQQRSRWVGRRDQRLTAECQRGGAPSAHHNAPSDRLRSGAGRRCRRTSCGSRRPPPGGPAPSPGSLHPEPCHPLLGMTTQRHVRALGQPGTTSGAKSEARAQRWRPTGGMAPKTLAMRTARQLSGGPPGRRGPYHRPPRQDAECP